MPPETEQVAERRLSHVPAMRRGVPLHASIAHRRRTCGLWLERDHGRPARELFEDPRFVADYVVKLARGLKTAIMLLNPARILIGGGIAKAGSNLFTPLRSELGRQMTAWSRARVDVRPAALGDDSVLFGALELAKTL